MAKKIPDEIEKERKWLLKSLPLMAQSVKPIHITQYYKDGYRYRMQQIFGEDAEYIKIKKLKIAVGINKETEIEKIDSVEFYINKTGSNKERREITKQRYTYNYENKKFEVDVFQTLTLIMMEVENVSVEEIISFPEEIEKVILIEVTGNEKFDNYSLGS